MDKNKKAPEQEPEVADQDQAAETEQTTEQENEETTPDPASGE